MKHTTKSEDQAFLRARIRDLQRPWSVGAACQSFKGEATTTIASIAGDTFFLADGTSGHRSRMRAPKRGAS